MNYSDAVFDTNSSQNVTTNTFFRQSVEDNSPEGRTLFEAYGVSTVANSVKSNCDNIYMNGIYMKAFSFSYYEKYVNTEADMGLFILCGGKCGNDLSKSILSDISAKVSVLKNTGNAKSIMTSIAEIISVYDQSYKQSGNMMDIGVLLIKGSKTYAYSFGEVRIVSIKNNVPMSISDGNSDSIGSGRLEKIGKGQLKVRSFKSDTYYVMESEGFAGYIDDEHICEAINNGGVKNGINNMIERAKTLNYQNSLTVLGINAKFKDEKSEKRKFAFWR